MNYEESMKRLNKDVISRGIIGISKIYEEIKRQNFVKWTEEYPEYWIALCEMQNEDITPEFAEAVMQTLKNSNIIELQMVWLFKCGEKLDIFGGAIDPEDKEI